MIRGGDERAVTVQIGAVLLLALLFVAFALYQVNTVPVQNEAVEITHNEEVQNDLVDVRNAIQSVDGGPRSVSVDLGTRYDTRTFAINPPHPRGTLESVEPGTGIHVENAAVDDPRINSILEDEVETTFLNYEPHYAAYQRAPETKLEHSLLYNQFDDGNVTVEDQRLIRDDEITLVVVDGEFSRTATRTVAVDVETLGGPGRTTMESDGTGTNATITIPTQSPERWNDSIGTSFGEGEPHAKITDERADRVTIELDGDRTYTLRIAKVGVGDEGVGDDRYDGTAGPVGTGNDSTAGPVVFDADAPDSVFQGDEFTLTATASSVGSERTIRSGTPIVGGEWKSDGPDGTSEGDLSVDGDPAALENVALEDQLSTEIDTAGWEPGEHSVTVWGQDASGRRTADSETAETTVEVLDDIEDGAYFDVTIDDTNEPVNEGETLTVDVTVENVGDETDTQTVELRDHDGAVVDSESASLEDGEVTTTTLTWSTALGDAGTGSVSVHSEDDVDTAPVEITEADTPGYDELYVSDVNGFVQPGNERQTIRFALDEGQQAWENVEIDVSEAQAGGVDYTNTFSDEDFEVVQGEGDVWDGGDETLVYQIDDSYEAGEVIELTIGSYATDGDGGPYDVTFTRTDNGEQAVTQFEIDGEPGAGDPFMDVSASDVSGDDQQTFSFTPGSKIESWENVEIDVSEATGNGLAYDWSPTVVQGAGSAWRSGDDLIYQVHPDDLAGEEIVLTVDLTGTPADGGSYDVTFTRMDTGDAASTSFQFAPD